MCSPRESTSESKYVIRIVIKGRRCKIISGNKIKIKVLQKWHVSLNIRFANIKSISCHPSIQTKLFSFPSHVNFCIKKTLTIYSPYILYHDFYQQPFFASFTTFFCFNIQIKVSRMLNLLILGELIRIVSEQINWMSELYTQALQLTIVNFTVGIWSYS